MGKSAAALHVTNGDAVLYLFRKAGIAGKHLAWRDPLNEGPVPADTHLEATSAVRALYLAARGYGAPIKIIHEFERRDAQLRRASEFSEVVLWFEHDLFDQLQLLQILVTLDAMQVEPGLVSTIQCDEYLGTMTVEELLALFPKRRTATEAIFRSARRGWDRLTSPDAMRLDAAAQEDAIGLPHLRAAMRRLCEEFPAVRDGLSRSQRAALQAVAQGPAGPAELFRRAQTREEASFHGERGFYGVLDDLGAQPQPAIEGPPEGRVLSALGRRLLAGDADWLEGRAVDRWIGGVHLTGDGAVRYDEASGRLRAAHA